MLKCNLDNAAAILKIPDKLKFHGVFPFWRKFMIRLI